MRHRSSHNLQDDVSYADGLQPGRAPAGRAGHENTVPTPGPWLRLLFGLFCGLWLYAFLPPMEQLGLLVGASSLLWILGALAVFQLSPWRWIRWLAGLVASCCYVMHWYAPASGVWASLHRLGVENRAQVIAAVQYHAFSNLLQTELFLVVLCCMFWLISYAASHVKLWVFYNVLALIVLGIVDSYTDVHPNPSIVTQMVLLVVVLGVLQFARFSQHLTHHGNPTIRYFLPLVVLLAFAAGLGWAIPKQKPAWPDPFQSFDHSVGSGGNGPGGAEKLEGFQLDNSLLGGSFVPNHAPVFSVIEPDPLYLRGAVYTSYTGRGWKMGSSVPGTVHVGSNLPVQFNTARLKSEKEMQKITVLSLNMKAPVLFAALSADQVVSDSQSNPSIQVDAQTGILRGPALQKGQTWTVESKVMQAPDGVLASLPPLPGNPQQVFDFPTLQPDLELPSSLPATVTQLSKQLTQGMHSEYDMVMAIQNYLKLNYSYQTQGIPVPGRSQDYVNQFLFDSKKGYCNNFSTSMAVMLRTLGIPTRWVTGFAPGKMDPKYSGSEERFIVSNNDAHSWVEVYFPQVGWVPFDPTPGFTMSFSPTASGNTTPAVPPVVKKPPVDNTPPADATPPQGTTTGQAAVHVPWAAILRTLAWIIGILVILGALVAFIYRRNVINWRHTRAWRYDTPQGMRRGVRHLVYLLHRYGELDGRKPESVTVRDLAGAARSYGIEAEDFQTFVQTWEQLAYGGQQPSVDRLREVREIWIRWILAIVARGQ